MATSNRTSQQTPNPRQPASLTDSVWSVTTTAKYDGERAALVARGAEKARRMASLEAAIAENPRVGIGKPKPLSGGGPLEDRWSRRIDRQNRLLYTINATNNEVLLLKCLGHYDDK